MSTAPPDGGAGGVVGEAAAVAGLSATEFRSEAPSEAGLPLGGAMTTAGAGEEAVGVVMDPTIVEGLLAIQPAAPATARIANAVSAATGLRREADDGFTGSSGLSTSTK